MSDLTLKFETVAWECIYCGGMFRNEQVAAYHFEKRHCETPWQAAHRQYLKAEYFPTEQREQAK